MEKLKRIKLSAELSRKSTEGQCIYLTSQLQVYVADVHKLIEVLQRLVEAGNSVVVIEHNLDVIKTADYIIDLGPEGGDKGGYIVAEGTPEEVSQKENSYTGHFLKKILENVK